jgi:hypothetical protein
VGSLDTVVQAHVGVAAVALDHFRTHADDVADLRVRQASAAQVDHRRGAQAGFLQFDCVSEVDQCPLMTQSGRTATETTAGLTGP